MSSREPHTTPVVAAKESCAAGLFDRLTTSSDEERLDAARSLWRLGPAATGPLLHALESAEDPVRAAAAESLGRIGDPVAVEPLLRELQRAIDCGRSPARRVLVWASLAAGVASGVAGAWVLWNGATIPAVIGGAGLVAGLVAAVLLRPRTGVTVIPCIAALANIAERSGSPECQRALPALERVAGYRFWLDVTVTAAMERVAERIRVSATGVIEEAATVPAELLGRSDGPATYSRVRAAFALRRFGESSVEPLSRALASDRAPAVRVAAAEALGALRGECSFQALLQALEDTEPVVRAAVAEALGQFEDGRAIAPLRRALQRSFPRKSARLQRYLGGAWLMTVPALLLASLAGGLHFRLGMALFVATNAALQLYSNTRRGHSLVCRAIAGSLGWIATSQPDPTLREVLRDLNSIAGDRVLQDEATRAASRAAARTIEELTAQAHNLPLASETPAESEATLPLPATASRSHDRSLPPVQG